MPRKMLTDTAWKDLKEILHDTGRVYNKYEHRMTIEGILYRMRAGYSGGFTIRIWSLEYCI